MMIFSVGEDGEQLELSHVTYGRVKWYNHFAKPFVGFLQNFLHLPYDLAILLYKMIYIRMFIIVPFISQKLEIIQTSINRKRESCNKILLKNKKINS